jgi:hypothetical protein
MIDPLAERYFTLSPYNYVANNPIMMYDPDGIKRRMKMVRCKENQLSILEWIRNSKGINM